MQSIQTSRLYNRFSPLRYPGGKARLSPHVIEILQRNKFVNTTYCEPFAGGAGIAWYLLLTHQVEKVWINDFSPAVYSFWMALFRHTNKLCRKIQETPVNVEQWFQQQEILRTAPIGFDLGFAAFFLNRTNRSGILKGGIIGGKTQQGKYKIDCRFNKEDLIARIKAIARFKKQVILTRLDARELLRKLGESAEDNLFLNIDPPYYEKGRGLYLDFFNKDDHAKLADIIADLKLPWMLTYDDVEHIRSLYQHFSIGFLELNYTVQTKRRAQELFILSHGLKPPKCWQEIH